MHLLLGCSTVLPNKICDWLNYWNYRKEDDLQLKHLFAGDIWAPTHTHRQTHTSHGIMDADENKGGEYNQPKFVKWDKKKPTMLRKKPRNHVHLPLRDERVHEPSVTRLWRAIAIEPSIYEDKKEHGKRNEQIPTKSRNLNKISPNDTLGISCIPAIGARTNQYVYVWCVSVKQKKIQTINNWTFSYAYLRFVRTAQCAALCTFVYVGSM